MMLGHYHYYIDTPDDGHDCMWSGDCCQALMTTTVTQTAVEATATLAPICLVPAESTTTEILTMTTATVTTTTTTTTTTTGESASVSMDESLDSEVATSTTSADTTVAANTRQGSKKSSSRHNHQQQQQQHNQRPDQQQQQQQLHNRGERNEASRGLQVANKKLRHREVEKNRHRQLQAMVKNISERIPGRLDKETQVQTMKRAARYCLYLRDIMNLLNHGQAQLPLQKTYLKAWDSVELMSQC